MSKIRCLECDTVIESKSRHDFQRCPCGNAFIDGGDDYVRAGCKVSGSLAEVKE